MIFVFGYVWEFYFTLSRGRGVLETRTGGDEEVQDMKLGENGTKVIQEG